MSNKLIAISIAGLLIACASGDSGYRRGSESDSSGSTAVGAAYAADGFAVQKKMKIRNENVYEFYYKRCELGSERAYFSKTSYECSEAPR